MEHQQAVTILRLAQGPFIYIKEREVLGLKRLTSKRPMLRLVIILVPKFHLMVTPLPLVQLKRVVIRQPLPMVQRRAVITPTPTLEPFIFLNDLVVHGPKKLT